MNEWKPFHIAPKDRPFIIRCDGEESVAQWDKDRKVFELETPFSSKVSNNIPVWKEVSEPPKKP